MFKSPVIAVQSRSGNKVDHYYEAGLDGDIVIFRWWGHCAGEQIVGTWEHDVRPFDADAAVAIADRGIMWVLRKEGH